jgi:hypothetical protein
MSESDHSFTATKRICLLNVITNGRDRGGQGRLYFLRIQLGIDDFMLSNISSNNIGIEKEETVSDRILVIRKEARVLHEKIMRCNVLEVSVNAESIAASLGSSSMDTNEGGIDKAMRF